MSDGLSSGVRALAASSRSLIGNGDHDLRGGDGGVAEPPDYSQMR